MTAVQRVEYITSQADKQQVLHVGYRYRLNVRRQVATHWMQGSLQYRWRSPPCGDRTESSTRIRSPVSSYESTETPNVGRCDTCTADLSADDANLASVKSGLYCHRRNVMSLNPQTRQGVDLEGIWAERSDGWRFMCVKDGVEENCLIFAIDEMLDNMQKVETLLMD